MARKTLSRAAGLEAACILFELNTDKAQLLRLAAEADLTPPLVDSEKLCREWYAFVHAAMVAALMVHAPNVVLADYLRSTTTLLTRLGLTEENCPDFVDDTFNPYMEMLAQERPKDCPLHFFRKLGVAEDLTHVPPKALALISTAMAITLSAIADKLEEYDIQYT